MTFRKTLLAVLFVLAQFLAVSAAVVPDGDNLPQDVGAPVLPGGKRDTARPNSGSSGSPGSSASPGVTISSTPGIAAPPGGVGKSGGPHPTAGRKDPARSGADKNPPDSAASSWSSADGPSKNYYVLGGLLLAFVVWLGWKLRQDDAED